MRTDCRGVQNVSKTDYLHDLKTARSTNVMSTQVSTSIDNFHCANDGNGSDPDRHVAAKFCTE